MTKITALLLIVWYSMSIIGFGVHTCNATDRSFIVTFLEDMSCDAVHPSDQCGEVSACCCCGHHAHESSSEAKVFIDAPDCCTNDYQVISSVTDRADDAKRLFSSERISFADVSGFSSDAGTMSHTSVMRLYRLSRSCLGARGVHLICNVWRI